MFQLLSLIEFKNLKKKIDFFDFFNIFNNSVYILFYYYYSVRIQRPAIRMTPSTENDLPIEEQAWLSIMTCIILAGITIKSMELVRFSSAMGKLVKLVAAVLNDVQVLFIFLILNICIFALYYLSLGYKITDEEVQDISYYSYFIESWKIATKGSSPSLVSFWDAYDKYHPLETILMFITIFNEIYLKIIMLSFLIALVKTTFTDQNRIANQNKYQQRCEMNTESSTAIKMVGFLEEADMLILSAQFDHVEKVDHIGDLRKEMHKEMKEIK